MKTEIKEFILEEHANACSEWKAKIEDKYPDLFKSEIEVGKWYKLKDSNFLIHITKILQDYGVLAYGWSYSNRWWDDSNFGSENLIPATDKEVKDALIAEAKKRGFKEGVKFELKEEGNTGTFTDLDFDHFFDQTIINNYGQCIYSGGRYVYKDGKWATIIEEKETVWSILAKQNLVNPADVQASLEKIETILTEIKSKL